ncbi:N-acetylglucosamine-6-sulfatase-like isoform X1 [Lycorma delicatula]|uniref:N-acetylglucosamine-6-sulfatase-like isoform X1 n=1 Tax=Lycorma delicatula TaxID=130591 RepID=UPI003F50E95B
MFKLYFFVFISTIVCIFAKKQPNIVVILTDDQDELLGGIAPMLKTRELIANNGVTFINSFVSTPICCPSRASILTGVFQHNHKTMNNSIDGGCSSKDWQNTSEKRSFATYLQSSGYNTFYAGKYLNQYGEKKVGGAQHVPPGWNWWLGLMGNSRYYNYSLSINGTRKHFSNLYLTNVIRHYSVEFLKFQVNSDKSFLMVLAPPAPHAPFIPEEKYKGLFNGTIAPRTPNFNKFSGKTKHWLTRMPPNPLTAKTVKTLDQIQQLRWETLLSVDDLVESVVTELQAKSILNDTYILFTSDNGFHLGQFGFAWDKRQMYESDIRVPLLLRGPNIPKKKTRLTPVVNIDIASTILDMAGISISPVAFDGISFLGVANGSDSDNRSRSFLIEYQGESNENKNSIDPRCPWIYDNNLTQCSIDADCKCQDSKNNSYTCLRRIDLLSNNFIYCEFTDSEYFREYYNLVHDPYELNNTINYLNEETKKGLHSTLQQLNKCKGSFCVIK